MKKKIRLLIAIFLSFQIFSLSVWGEEIPTTEVPQSSSTTGELENPSSTDQVEQTDPTEQIDPTVKPSASSTEASEESTSESTPDSTVVSGEEEQETTTPKTGTMVTAAGNGTETNPYLVSTFQELKDAFATPVAAGETQYIQLQNDIIYDSTFIYIKQNTVIDGNGHALLYNGTNYGTAHFSTNANNIDVTYKNLTFGNSEYPNSSYYGILYTHDSNVHFTVENINYNILNGCQPFWGNNNSGNTLTFKGKNNFYSSGKSYGGEFVEGFPTVTFADNSETTVYNDSPNASAVFYSLNQSVTIGKQASLAIEASKPYLFYNSATLNVQEQGKFSYKSIYGKNYTSNTATLCTGTLTANFEKDSIGHFTTDVDSFSGSNPKINLNSPEYVAFDSTKSSEPVLGTMNPIFKRVDTDTSLYQIAYLTASGQNTYVPEVNPGSSYTVTSTNIGKGYSVVYAKMPSIESLSTTPSVGPDVSSIDAQIESVAPATTTSSKVQYKLATKPLYSGDITTEAAQTSIQNAGTSEGVKEQTEVSLPGNSPPIGADTKYSFKELPAEDYYLYAKVDSQQVPGYTFESRWKDATAEVPPYVLIQFSNSSMEFNSPIPGTFGKQQNLDRYTMRNAGNVPTEVSLKSITRNSDSSEQLSLVDQFHTNNQELILSLIAEKVDSGEQTVFGPLTDGDFINSSTIQLNPFWDKDAQAVLYLTGDYSGPMIGEQKFSYRFSFAISAATTN
ncbi:pectate lyase-like adhesive domain-containing protein [Listeria ilorinensis]|uniref:pectate lyase-like adhesive domain-containing protein n=1 Tax=Listeria ilorinensis TaxID=2867439 RepID=UPI001EF6024B|nr:pectate lyase-like adhesive domain-containing protein [Listeria ilorinensis]